MDANHIAAGKATAEADMTKKRANEYVARMFDEATSIDQVLAYLAGGASVCWTERPRGEFMSEKADVLVDLAKARIVQIVRDGMQLAADQIKAEKEANNGE